MVHRARWIYLIYIQIEEWWFYMKIKLLLSKISMVDIEEKTKSVKRLQRTLQRLINKKLNSLLHDYNQNDKSKFLLLNPS